MKSKKMSDDFLDSELPFDLSNYYVVRRHKHGWVLRDITTKEEKFIARRQLAKMGYIHDNNISITPPAQSSVIMVPNDDARQRSRSLEKHCSCDQVENWRKKG